MRDLDVMEPQFLADSELQQETLSLRFERIAAAMPDRHAIETAQDALTYRELNAMADSVAAQLAAGGYDRSRPVALMIQDMRLFVAAMLGAAKAGHMFIPFETSSPNAWCAEVVKESGTTLILTDEVSQISAQRVALENAAVLNLQPDHRIASRFEGVPVSPDDPAYILYTSGSSGRPKGVVISHRAAVHHVDIRTEHFDIREKDRFALLHAPGFAAGTINLLVTLLNGACLLPFPLQKQSLHKFSDWINEQRITSFSIVGSLFRTWLAQLPEGLRFPSLRLIIPTSEALYGADVTRIARHLMGDWKLGHILAITETGTVSGYMVDSSTALEPGVLPVGTPLRDLEVRIEDDEGAQVASGEIGEIVVRSRYISLGYWKEPVLTAAAFRNDPHDPAIRLYRTGDLGRWRGDGLLEHLGRRDRKVKLRGYSIELYEVECALLRVPGVRDAAVILHERAQGNAQLVAYAVADRIASGSAN